MTLSSPQETYQVIARKYRPQTFTDVIGQESIVTTLKNALRFHRLAHAYLFCGCRGTGKTTLARVFSKALNCLRLTADFEPCNECSSCLEVSQGRSLDVMEIDGASHRGIDDIRQINETIGYASSSGKYKIYIIDEVHMLTKEAFNALLKTLEEPPANVKFFFATTEPHKVLPTIMSRCQRFDLNRITPDLIQKKLAMIAGDFALQYEDEALQMIARLGEGSLRDAESLFDQVICYTEGPLTTEKVSSSLGLVSSSTFFELDQAVEAQDFSYAFVLAEKIFSSGKDLSYFLDSLMDHFRTVLAVQLKQPIALSSSLQRKYAASALTYSQEQCLYILDYLIQWTQQLSKSSFKRIGLEMTLLHIIRSKQRIPIDTLVRKLKELEQSIKAGSPAVAAQAPLPKPVEAPKPEMKVPVPIPEPIEAPKQEIKAPEPIREPVIVPIAPVAKIPEPIAEVVAPVAAPEEPAPVVIPAPVAETPPPRVSEAPAAPKEKNPKAQIKYDTLMRFAAVELEGVLTKELR